MSGSKTNGKETVDQLYPSEPNFEAGIYSGGFEKAFDKLSLSYIAEDLMIMRQSIGYIFSKFGKETAEGVLRQLIVREGREAADLALEFKRLAKYDDKGMVNFAVKLIDREDIDTTMKEMRMLSVSSFKRSVLGGIIKLKRT